MEININETLISKFIETKNLNILIANIYNTYLNECRQNIDEFIVSRNSDKNNAIYYAWLEALEIDKDDFEFSQLSKQYHLNEIKELSADDFNGDPFLRNIKKDIKSTSKWNVSLKQYAPYECFLYDSLEVKETSFYKEISKLGYFKCSFTYIEATNKFGNIISINPYEITILNNELKILNGKILAVGLGLGYFSYLASLKADINEISILEEDDSLIELFNENVSPFICNTKITIINDSLTNKLNDDLNKYDFIYITLPSDINKALKKYIEYKKIELSFKKVKFIYHNEVEILALIRRYIIILFEENLEGFTKKDYIKSKTFEDKFINALFSLLENKKFTSRSSIDNLLSDDSLKSISQKISI